VRPGRETLTRYFLGFGGTGTDLSKGVRRNYVFASGGIRGSRSALRGMKHCHTIFHARVGPV
jgi:hypothetical protein